MTGPDIVAKLRKHLDKHGYQDVEIKIIGDVPWAKLSYDNDISRALMSTYDQFGIEYVKPIASQQTILGGYWPAYLFSGDPLNIPIIGGAAGSGGNAHAANEFWVIEGADKAYGMAGAEKSVATVLFNYAGLNGPATEHAKQASAAASKKEF
jgi:acetylornithine deacetylase/succinyl-diaminopimelate desuccinylase-like protein